MASGKKKSDWRWPLIIFLFIIDAAPLAVLLLVFTLFGDDEEKEQPKKSTAKRKKTLAGKKSGWRKIVGGVLAFLGLFLCVEPLESMLWLHQIKSYYVEDLLVALAFLIGGVVVLAMGLCLGIYYLSHGIFYDGESFLVSTFGRKDRSYRYDQIREQTLYLIQGGNVIIELHMEDGTAVSLQSAMDGIYLFLDTAFAGWCLQKGIDPQTCEFHDPSRSWWFPHEEEA